MKKTGFVFVTMLTVLLSGLLMACSFKNTEASFSQNEIVVSLKDSINLDNYLEVRGVDENDIDYRFSNSSLFESQGDKFKAVASGKTIVYATYQNHSLDSMQIIVKKQFSSPTNFNVTNGVLQSKTGLLTWDVVSDFFVGSDATSSSSYTLSGVYTTSDGQQHEVSSVENGNSYQLSEEGYYSLTVTANAAGYFDASLAAAIEFAYGLIELPQDYSVSLSSNGVLSWSDIGAKYRVKIDDVILGKEISTTSEDISIHLEKLPAGTHNLSVMVYDAEGTKLPNQSKILQIEKLETPKVQYDALHGGKIKINNVVGAKEYVISLEELDTENIVTFKLQATGDDLLTSLDGVELDGAYELSVVAVGQEGSTYQSNACQNIDGQTNLVYKLPKLTLEGVGGNEINGTILNANISTKNQSLFDTKVAISGVEHSDMSALLVGENEKEISIQLENAGLYSLATRLLPSTAENVFNGSEIFVLNGDESEVVEVIKLAFVGEEDKIIEHKYVGENSVFVFDKVYGAGAYEIKNGGVTVQLAEDAIKESGDKVEITFDGKIGEIFTEFEFEIIAKGQEDKLSIGASATKILSILQAPTSVVPENVSDKTYKWNPSAGASGYTLEIYFLDKEKYESILAGNLDLAGLTVETKEVEIAEFTFESEGYYFVKVFANSNSENEYLNSKDCLQETFYISEKLALGQVALGYDASYSEKNPTSDASGYFVRMANIENVAKYKISVDGIENEMDAASGDYTDYMLTTDFSSGAVEISVVGVGSDNVVYLDSDAKTISVQKLESITYAALEAGDAAYVDDSTQNIVVKAVQGAREIYIRKDKDNKAQGDNENDAIFPIGAQETNFELEFEILGTQIGEDNLYQGDMVYLDAEKTVLQFVRYETPTELEYKNGKLTFVDADASADNAYVLIINCKTAQGGDFEIKIEFGSIFAVAKYNETSTPIGESLTFRSISTPNVTIDIDKIIQLVNSTEELASVYANAAEVEFEVYVDKNEYNSDKDSYQISSLNATLKQDSSQSALTIEKMSSPTLEFDSETETTYILKWSPVTTENLDVNNETTYQIYSTGNEDPIEGTLLAEADGVVSFEFSKSGYKAGQYYNFYIVAENPYYLESNKSNLIRLYKLSAVENIKVKDDGKLELEISSTQKDLISKVLINGEEVDTYTDITAPEGASLTVKLVGKIGQNETTKTYYIDSDISTWVVSQLSSLAPSSLTLTYNDNGDLTWAKFGESAGLNSLKYRVYFKDEKGQVVYHGVAENKINVLSGEVYNKISTSLSAGIISVQVVAYLEAYSAVNDATAATIYISEAQTTFAGELYNAFIYRTTTITKLSTPNISKIEFDSVEYSTYPTFEEEAIAFDTQNPSTIVYFTGNYGDSVTVIAYANDVIVFEGTIAKASDETYSFEVDSAYYEFDKNGVMTIKIKAMVAGTIASSIGSVEIYRAEDLKSLEFVKDGEAYTTDLKISLGDNGSSAVGGIVLKVEYTNDEGISKTIYTLANISSGNEHFVDLQELVAENLSKGGNLKVSAFVNSNADEVNKKYYLPSENVSETSEIEVLKAVEEKEITRQAGGFVISTDNGSQCSYIISYGQEEFKVTSENSFYFEFPDDWVNGTYSLVVYAKEEGKMSSVETTLDFTLSRIVSVDKASIVFARSETDLSKITMSWAAVEGATGYLFRVYDLADETLLYETTLVSTSNTLENIFGGNYTNLNVDNAIDYFKEDKNLRFDISVIGDATTSNNSKITTLKVLLKGNALLGEAEASRVLNTDEFGRLKFSGVEGESYIYKFSADELDEQLWQELVAENETILNTNEFSKLVENLYFNMQFANKGDENAFELDSYVWSTQRTTLSLKFNNLITYAGYNENLASGIALEILSGGFEKIYAGTSENSVFEGDFVSLPFAETSISPSSNTNKVYGCDFANLLDAFAENEIELPVSENELKVFLWAQTAGDVVSMPYEFNFILSEETTFEDIAKLGESGDAHDYSNVYAIFANSDVVGAQETLGLYVKIESEQFESPIIKFLSQDQLVSDDYANKYVVNLTNLFEEPDLIDMTGEFKISFARIQLQEGTTFVLSNWLESDEAEEFLFTRLPSVSALHLSEGNVEWSGYDGGKYYVYFIQEMDETTQKLGEKYLVQSTKENYIDASKFVGTSNAYYIAVQTYAGDSEDACKYVLPSKRVFVSQLKDETIVPSKIYKNQVNSPIILKDGKLYIEWSSNSELFAILETLSATSSDLIKEIPFVNPFTFTISDLMENNITFRLKFTSAGDVVGVEKTFDINAKDLLGDLFAENDVIKEALETLYGNEQSDLTKKSLIKQFIDYCENASYGIGNSKKLFDEVFENLQAGSYSMQYCLIGGSSTVNSSWYDFKNENGENLIYVNAEPATKITKTATDDETVNVYRMFIKKSYITTYDETNGYTQSLADNYVVRLVSGGFTYVLQISKGITDYSLTLQDSQISTSVSVYQTDENGVEVMDDAGNAIGEYLMFYINHNGGNSLLGVYGEEIVKNSFEMQTYAVGNNVSMSSKSQYHSLTLLSFGTGISIVDGEFVWTPHLKRSTTVVFKRTNSSPTSTEVGLSSDLYYSRFSLNSGEGYYEYVKFIAVGETKTNSTFIDSEVYTFNGIYKLGTPTTDMTKESSTILSNKLGYLAIDLGTSNKTRLDDSYSETNIYNYRIYNDASNYSWNRASTYISVADDRSKVAGVDTLYYQPGITGVDSSNHNYAYKSTESKATSYSVALMGSTVTNITYQIAEEENGDEYNENYYLRTFKRVDSDGETLLDFNVALRSNFANIDAQMMSDMGDLSIEDSLIKWNDVRTSAADETLSVETPIYRVSVKLYTMSQTGSDETDQTQTDILKDLIYYTANTSFDISKIEEDLLESSSSSTLINVTVQAIALTLSSSMQESGCVELIEGGYAYGNAYYLDSQSNKTETFVFVSNGASLDGISRFKSVENLSIENGKLTWTFEAEKSLSQTAFKEKYGFEVVQKVDNVEKIVGGTYTISENDGIYTIVFSENKGEMLEGESTFVVYAKQGTDAAENLIKSFATSIDGVTKLATISNDDFEIVSGVDYETLDFTNYFNTNQDNVVTLNSKIGGVEQSAITLTKSTTKLYIFKQAPTSEIQYEDGYAKAYLVITDNSVANLNFVVTNDSSKTIYSDVSDEIVLQRSSWGESAQISWNEITQEFSWDFEYNSFAADEELEVLEIVYLASKTILLYNDEVLSEESGLSLENGEFVSVVEQGEVCTEIIYDGQTYYVSSNDIAAENKIKAVALQDAMLFGEATLTQAAKDEKEQDIVLAKDCEIVVLEIFDLSSKIVYEGQAYYISNADYAIAVETVAAGELVKIIEETDSKVVVENEEGKLLRANLSEVEIVRPKYTVQAMYGKGADAVVRTYTTDQKSFKPTVVGDVSISVIIKLGATNVESQKLLYDTDNDDIADFVEFDLFAGGAGTSSSPYQITSASELENIQYRMIKEEYLQNYYQEGVESFSGDGSQYYFELVENVSLETTGILLKGEFNGVFNGLGNKISYISTKTETLTETLTVEQKKDSQNTISTTFSRGAALFEIVSSNAVIDNLVIEAVFGSGATLSGNNSIVAGLAIQNNGQISNVSVIGFENYFYGQGGSSQLSMSYAGLVGINSGNSAKITNGEFLANVAMQDYGVAQIINFGGLAYANLNGGTVENSVAGSESETYGLSINCSSTNDTIQVGGIVVVNSSTSTLNSNTNHLGIVVETQQTNTFAQVYIGGIACYGWGTTTDNNSTATTENGRLTTSGNFSSVKVGNVFAVN